jgi:hypothetical protein
MGMGMARIYMILGRHELDRSEIQVSLAVMTYCDLSSNAVSFDLLK